MSAWPAWRASSSDEVHDDPAQRHREVAAARVVDGGVEPVGGDDGVDRVATRLGRWRWPPPACRWARCVGAERHLLAGEPGPHPDALGEAGVLDQPPERRAALDRRPQRVLLRDAGCLAHQRLPLELESGVEDVPLADGTRWLLIRHPYRIAPDSLRAAIWSQS